MADCPGSHGAHVPIIGERLHGRCPSCGRRLRLVGGDVYAGWGRTRLPRHHAPSVAVSSARPFDDRDAVQREEDRGDDYVTRSEP